MARRRKKKKRSTITRDEAVQRIETMIPHAAAGRRLKGVTVVTAGRIVRPVGSTLVLMGDLVSF